MNYRTVKADEIYKLIDKRRVEFKEIQSVQIVLDSLRLDVRDFFATPLPESKEQQTINVPKGNSNNFIDNKGLGGFPKEQQEEITVEEIEDQYYLMLSGLPLYTKENQPDIKQLAIACAKVAVDYARIKVEGSWQLNLDKVDKNLTDNAANLLKENQSLKKVIKSLQDDKLKSMEELSSLRQQLKEREFTAEDIRDAFNQGMYEYSNGRNEQTAEQYLDELRKENAELKDLVAGVPSRDSAEVATLRSSSLTQIEQLKTTFRFYKSDAEPYIGAYKIKSLTDGEPTIMFNMEAVISIAKDENNKAEFLQDVMLQTITHEFCHSMQEWLGKEYNELEVEKILGAYNEKWNVFNAEAGNTEDDPMFSIPEFLKALDTLEVDGRYDAGYHYGAGALKDQIRKLFAPYQLWHEGEKQHRRELEMQCYLKFGDYYLDPSSKTKRCKLCNINTEIKTQECSCEFSKLNTEQKVQVSDTTGDQQNYQSWKNKISQTSLEEEIEIEDAGKQKSFDAYPEVTNLLKENSELKLLLKEKQSEAVEIIEWMGENGFWRNSFGVWQNKHNQARGGDKQLYEQFKSSVTDKQ